MHLHPTFVMSGYGKRCIRTNVSEQLYINRDVSKRTVKYCLLRGTRVKSSFGGVAQKIWRGSTKLSQFQLENFETPWGISNYKLLSDPIQNKNENTQFAYL